MHRRMRASSTDLTTTEFNDGLRVCDRLVRFLESVQIGRRSALATVRITSRDVMLVKLFSSVDERTIWPLSIRQRREQEAEHMSPCILMEHVERGLHGLFVRLL